MTFTMYEVTHKPVEIVPNGRTPLFVGTGDNAKKYICDSNGDNISSKNKYYCELTAYYWIWKNDRSDYVSIELFYESDYDSADKRKKNIADFNKI